MLPSSAVLMKSELMAKDGSVFATSHVLDRSRERFRQDFGGMPDYVKRPSEISALVDLALQETRSPELLALPAHAGNPIDSPYYTFLMLATAWLKPALVVELGTDYGVSAVHLQLGNPDTKVLTIDHSNRCEESLREMEKRVRLPVGGIEFWQMDTAEAAMKARALGLEPEILFVDSCHDFDTPKKELELWAPTLSKRGHIFMDDVLSPRDMVHHLWDIIDWDRMEIPNLHPTGNQGFGVVFVPQLEPRRPILRTV